MVVGSSRRVVDGPIGTRPGKIENALAAFVMGVIGIVLLLGTRPGDRCCTIR